MTLLFFLAGLLLLVVGAEILVRGASHLAFRFGVTPLVIGLTVVAFGTSSPELAVSFKAAFSGQTSLVVGNVVGSNIFNVLCVLGLSALAGPLVVQRQLVRLDVPLLIVLSVLTYLLALDGALTLPDGALLFGGLIGYLGFLLVQQKTPVTDEERDESAPDGTGRLGLDLVMVVAGLVLLVLGSRWLVSSATSMAQALGVSELVIGLTVVAAGTSLPELVTSLVAGLRGERDLAVGNAVGSSLFNLMGVLGLSALVAPGGIEISTAAIGFDLPVMVATAIVCLPIFVTGGRISRWEGVLLFAYYIAYTLYLLLATAQHEALPRFSATMLYFAIPLTALGLLIATWQALRSRRVQQSSRHP